MGSGKRGVPKEVTTQSDWVILIKLKYLHGKQSKFDRKEHKLMFKVLI